MKAYIQATISGIESALSVEAFEHHLLIASDLLDRNFSEEVRNSFRTVDFNNEVIEEEDLNSIQTALLEVLRRNLSVREEGAVIQSLSRTRDPHLIPLFEQFLEKHLRLLLAHNANLYSALYGLELSGAPAFNSTSRSLIAISDNVSTAQKYLLKKGISVPWSG